MRKILFFAALLLVSFANAKTNVYDFKTFVVNENDEVVVTRVMNTSKNAEFINKNVVTILEGEDGTLNQLSSENGVTKFEGIFQTQSIYNPFAGMTKRKLSFDLVITVANGQATFAFTNLKVNENYMGYGMSDKRYDVTQKMIEYNKQRAIYDSTDKKAYSKEEKKKAAEIVDQISNELDGSDEELGLRLSQIEEAIQ